MYLKKVNKMKTCNLSDIIIEMSKETKINEDKLKFLLELFIRKVTDKSLKEKVFINRLGSFSTKMKTRKGFNGLKLNRDRDVTNEDVILLEEGGLNFVTKKAKIHFVPAVNYTTKVKNFDKL